MKDSKAINLMVEKLKSKNADEVLFGINQIRNSGNTNTIPQIIELLNNKPGTEIEKAIIGLLNDLKVQAGTIEIIKALRNSGYQSIHKQLLVSCWESGLNYSAHLDFFVDLFLNSKFELAFEAFTIIENIEDKLSRELVNPLIIKLKSAISSIPTEKSELLIELIHILEEMSDLQENEC